MSADDHSTKHIIQSLIANFLIACAKGVAAFFTGSGAMLAETIHSAADCTNQVLLLLGVKRAKMPPDEKHPLGYGRALYFWSFIVALLLFAGGGVFSIYEGIHKITNPEPVERIWIGLVVLGFSLLLEGGATFSNIKEINKRRGDKAFFKYLQDTKDSDLVVVFGENAAATLGLIFALAALGLAYLTGDGRYDGLGGISIGLVLIGVSVFLAVEIKSLLMGESADPEIAAAAKELADKQPNFKSILNVITIQQGPGEVLVAIKVYLDHEISSTEVCETINQFEIDLKTKCPEIKWCFVEPDLPKDKA